MGSSALQELEDDGLVYVSYIMIYSFYAFASRGLQQFFVLQRLCSGLYRNVLSFLCLMPYPETEE